MLMEDFEEWREGAAVNKENFLAFLEQHCQGKNIVELLGDISWQVYQLQVCMEGIIEDVENI